MKNVQDKSPLDIAKERWRESLNSNDGKKKEVLEYVLHEMDCTLPILPDDDDDDQDDKHDDEADEDDEHYEDDDDDF